MDEAQALKIITSLAEGVHPQTGEIFPEDSPYQDPQIVRALFAVVRMLDGKRTATRPRTEMPGNAGKPWGKDEDQLLKSGFNAGKSIPDLAQQHQRTTAGIQARLEKHGLVTPQPGAIGASVPGEQGRQRKW